MKFNLISITVIIAVMVLVTSCCQTNNSLTDQDRADITKTHKAATDPIAADPSHADWKVFTENHYSKDAVLLPSNSIEIVGHNAIIAYMSSFPPLKKFKVEDVEMKGTKELVYIKYSYEMIMMINDTTEITDIGKGIELWKKNEEGNWRCFLDTWNTNMPATQ